MALPKSTNIFAYPARFQFGQANAPCGGSSCCTDTCIQMIVEYYKDQSYSLAEIRRRAEAKTSFDERACTGINHIEALNALEACGVTHYKAGFGVTWANVVSYLAYGPVLVGVYYGSYPKSTTGRCGSTNKAEYSGKTDCGFNGAHAVLVIGTRTHRLSNGTSHRDFYTRDPDHNSAARPEKPIYDIITASQLRVAMENLPKYTAFNSTYALYPTRKKVLETLPPPPPVIVTPTPVTKKAACNNINLRTSASLTASIKAQINSGTVITVAGTVTGAKWSVVCPTSKTGSAWYKISHVNGKTTSSLYGVSYLYGATGLFI